MLNENAALRGSGRDEIMEVIVISENLKLKFPAQLSEFAKAFLTWLDNFATSAIKFEVWIKKR